jgi:hypothetical protein
MSITARIICHLAIKNDSGAILRASPTDAGAKREAVRGYLENLSALRRSARELAP